MDYIFAERNFICLAMVRGYLNKSMEWIPPEVMQRFGYANMAQFYASDPSRLALSDIETRRENLCLLDIRSTIPSGTSYILADEQQTGLSGDTQHRCLPFLEKNGEYSGQPEDDQHAINELERLRGSGCTHIVFAWPAMWWLDHYTEMDRHLRSQYRCVLENERLVVFDLRA